MLRYLQLTFFVVLTYTAAGQKLWQKLGYELVYPVCYASDEVEKSYTPPPAGFNKNLKSAEKLSDIVVNYNGFPPEAIDAFEYAIGIWEQLIESPVPIHIDATMKALGTNTLGSCGPTGFNSNFPGATKRNVYYPIALEEKLRRSELTGPNRPDMLASFNNKISWYYGTDGNPDYSQFDFVSVVLHEIGHGLGFIGFFEVLKETGGYKWWDWGDATIYDHLVENYKSEKLTDSTIFENQSDVLRRQLVSDSLYFDSPAALALGLDSRPRLYAPENWSEGSSIYHLHDATYLTGNENSLMTHSFSRGEAIHNPGPATLGMLADMGWANIIFEHTPLQDLEVHQPIKIDVNIESTFPLDHDELYLVYFTDSLISGADSVLLENKGQNNFSATVEVEEDIELLSYFFIAADTIGREFKYPSGAPVNSYHVRFGTDLIEPIIEHEPIPFFLDTGEGLSITARVEDNVAIDTVMVRYSINGLVQPAFGLSKTSNNIYSGQFPFDDNTTNDLDQITYQIQAIDASSNKNEARFPENDYINFFIEKVYNPVSTFESDFENGHYNFTLRHFEMYTAEGFKNGALHSPHPYPSPEEDDISYNFSTILKRPVILIEPAIMEFDEVVLVEPGNEGADFGDMDFWDYVVVEGSKDKGMSWQPLTSGYDSGADTLWEESYYESITNMNSITAGTSDLYKSRKIDMLKNGNFTKGDTILIRFRLYSDPFVYGWGWAIDNLKIQPTVTASQQTLSSGNIRIYPNPFSGKFKILAEPDRPLELLQYELYNMHGQIVKSLEMKKITGPVTTEVTLENGQPGIYFLVVKENGKRVLSKKIIHN